MASAWKPMTAIPDFVDCPSHILVWNECNGVSEIAVTPDDIWNFRENSGGWRLWRDVPEPSEADIERAMQRALREARASLDASI